jgi:hypothetical protein
MTLEEEIAGELSERICSEIDFEILSDILIRSCDWQRIHLERFRDNEQAVDIANWCQDGCRAQWLKRGSTFLFKDRGDAVNFALKWVR